ncbi:MAG: hypothetical protein PHF86_05105 [Candidatus Nanoarchaeia archaeon]|jgi:hypothetical protein|nr:hypothetical protein [Candidatus Nanoarchaeia archaeon]
MKTTQTNLLIANEVSSETISLIRSFLYETAIVNNATQIMVHSKDANSINRTHFNAELKKIIDPAYNGYYFFTMY